jgi:hypothetical protein
MARFFVDFSKVQRAIQDFCEVKVATRPLDELKTALEVALALSVDGLKTALRKSGSIR